MEESDRVDYDEVIRRALKEEGRYTDNEVIVTPRFAEALLNLRDDNEQRPVGANTVNDYATQMRNKEWILSPDPLAVSNEGKLTNGQHRMEALLRVGIPQPFDIVWNARPEEFMVTDQQRRRTPGDIFANAGYRGNHKAFAAACTALHLYDTARDIPKKWATIKVSNHQRLVVARNNPGLRDCLSVGTALRGIGLNMTATTVGYYVCKRAWPQGAGVMEEFLQALHTGENMSKGDPAMTLREWSIMTPFRRSKAAAAIPARVMHLNLFIRTWNARCVGREMSSISWKTDFTIPLPYSDGGSGRQPTLG